jgi:uncharacterized protein (DUF1800 family)
MSDDAATIAHVLRRTTFGPHPGQVERYARLGIHRTIDELLAGPVDQLPASIVDRGRFEDGESLPAWWLDRLRRPATGVHEKLVWYWHGHFPSSVDKVSPELLWRQHHLLRKHALGNFRELVQAIAIDGAMLRYLDGDGSHGDAPNENFARELLEVFCLGRGTHTEDDVRAAARACSGWRVDDENRTVVFAAEASYDRPVTFLGRRARWDMRSIVDAVVDHPACARHVAARMWAFYVGTEPASGTLDALAATFRAADLEIRTLLRAILRSEEFLAARHARPRQPLEWLLAVLAVTGQTDREIDLWWLDQLGQVPFRPPNVGGWPNDGRWASAGQMVVRTSLLRALELHPAIVDRLPADPAAVLSHCGIHDASASTRAALRRAIAAQTEYDQGLELLFVLALSAPEFTLL